jgi:hypothetical protein
VLVKECCCPFTIPLIVDIKAGNYFNLQETNSRFINDSVYASRESVIIDSLLEASLTVLAPVFSRHYYRDGVSNR